MQPEQSFPSMVLEIFEAFIKLRNPHPRAY
jgi:hypothetical protein